MDVFETHRPKANALGGTTHVFFGEWRADIPMLGSSVGRPLPCKYFLAVWRSASKEVGLAGAIPHDLRRPTARDFARAGVPQHWVMKLCG